MGENHFESKHTKDPPEVQVPSFFTALVAGGMAGTAVDVALFPIDTLKTRLQSPQGFWKAGGFRGIYNGLGAAAAGSAPGAALFFATYEGLKPFTSSMLTTDHRRDEETNGISSAALSHMAAASVGEAVACLVRVPTEVIKAKMQTASTRLGLLETIRQVTREKHHNALTGGLYRGYGITLFREIPFAMIQFPLYERFKIEWSAYQQYPVTPWQAAACGSVSGAVGAFFTTPLDVLKTRLMLGANKDGKSYRGVRDVWQQTVSGEGYGALWKGVQPRVFWISLGGFVFFGAYEESKKLVEPLIE